MQPALEETDHEGVTCDGGTQEIGERRGESVAWLGAERLAAAKPNQRVITQALAKRTETIVQRVTGRQRSAIEALAIDHGAAPLAVTPELKLGDRSSRLVHHEPAEGFFEAPRAEGRIDTSETAVEMA